MSASGKRRVRHRPEQAERAILVAARAFLEQRPFREMKVEDVMTRTGLSRPAFYAYFHDRYDLITRLLENVGGLLFAVDRRWLVGGRGEGSEEARGILSDALRRGSETIIGYGPVLRAIADAASQDARVEDLYRHGLIERLISAVSERIERDVETGITVADLNPEETARALVLMSERYLLDAFELPSDPPSQEKVAAMVGTLEGIWIRTLYGPES